jgi:hypothetical protein
MRVSVPVKVIFGILYISIPVALRVSTPLCIVLLLLHMGSCTTTVATSLCPQSIVAIHGSRSKSLIHVGSPWVVIVTTVACGSEARSLLCKVRRRPSRQLIPIRLTLGPIHAPARYNGQLSENPRGNFGLCEPIVCALRCVVDLMRSCHTSLPVRRK